MKTKGSFAVAIGKKGLNSFPKMKSVMPTKKAKFKPSGFKF